MFILFGIGLYWYTVNLINDYKIQKGRKSFKNNSCHGCDCIRMLSLEGKREKRRLCGPLGTGTGVQLPHCTMDAQMDT